MCKYDVCVYVNTRTRTRTLTALSAVDGGMNILTAYTLSRPATHRGRAPFPTLPHATPGLIALQICRLVRTLP
jgi:hypothetical protein